MKCVKLINLFFLPTLLFGCATNLGVSNNRKIASSTTQQSESNCVDTGRVFGAGVHGKLWLETRNNRTCSIRKVSGGIAITYNLFVGTANPTEAEKRVERDFSSNSFKATLFLSNNGSLEYLSIDDSHRDLVNSVFVMAHSLNNDENFKSLIRKLQ